MIRHCILKWQQTIIKERNLKLLWLIFNSLLDKLTELLHHIFSLEGLLLEVGSWMLQRIKIKSRVQNSKESWKVHTKRRDMKKLVKLRLKISLIKKISLQVHWAKDRSNHYFKKYWARKENSSEEEFRCK